MWSGVELKAQSHVLAIVASDDAVFLLSDVMCV